jgi:hypothetical protein
MLKKSKYSIKIIKTTTFEPIDHKNIMKLVISDVYLINIFLTDQKFSNKKTHIEAQILKYSKH